MRTIQTLLGLLFLSFAFQPIFAQQQQRSCIDSDRDAGMSVNQQGEGSDKFIQGTTRGYDSRGRYVTKTDSCAGERLVEYYCANNRDLGRRVVSCGGDLEDGREEVCSEGQCFERRMAANCGRFGNDQLIVLDRDVHSDQPAGACFSGYDPTNVVLDCDGHTISGPGAEGISIIGGSNITIKNCTITGFNSGIHAIGSIRLKIKRNTLENNTREGISVCHGKYQIIQNRILQNRDGIFILDDEGCIIPPAHRLPNPTLTISHNTICENHRQAFSCPRSVGRSPVSGGFNAYPLDNCGCDDADFCRAMERNSSGCD